MATDTIPSLAAIRKEAHSGLWGAGVDLECLAVDAERIAETAHGLSTAEAFSESAQCAFAALAQLADALKSRAITTSETVYDCARKLKGEGA